MRTVGSLHLKNAFMLDAEGCHILTQAAHLDELRRNSRSDEKLYAILHGIRETILAATISVEGKQATEATEPREAGTAATPTQIAKAVGVHPRTIRNDIHRGLLQARLVGRQYIITAVDAQAYIAGRRTA